MIKIKINHFLLILFSVIGVLIFSDLFGIVKFTYPKVTKVENALHHPVKVAMVDGTKLILHDGRIIETGVDEEKLKCLMEKSEFQIELEDVGVPSGVCFEIYSNLPTGLCGTQWSGILLLRLIPIPITLKSIRNHLGAGELFEK